MLGPDFDGFLPDDPGVGAVLAHDVHAIQFFDQRLFQGFTDSPAAVASAIPVLVVDVVATSTLDVHDLGFRDVPLRRGTGFPNPLAVVPMVVATLLELVPLHPAV